MLPLAVVLLRYLRAGMTLHSKHLQSFCPEQEERGHLLTNPLTCHKNKGQKITSPCFSIFQLIHVICVVLGMAAPDSCDWWNLGFFDILV